MKFLVFFGVIGFCIALLTGLSHRFPWLESFCTGPFGGCRETDNFSVMGWPLWAWGVGYFTVLAPVTVFAGGMAFWLVATGFGVEMALVWTMLSMKVVCMFCLGNLVVMLLLLGFSFEKRRFWQNVAVSAVVAMATLLLVTRDDNSYASSSGQANEAIAAKVGEQKIPLEEVESPLASRTYELEMQIYRLKRERLDQLIAEKVLQKEADERGIPLQQFVNETVLANRVEVSADDMERYYSENPAVRSNWRGTPEELERQVRATILQKKTYQAVMDYVKGLYDKDQVVVLLKEPELPQVQVNVGKDAVSGPANAPVTIVQFSDYLCPACRKNHEIMRGLKEQYKDNIRWAFKDFPLRMHKWAEKAAEAARCAGDQGKFYAYQDLLFSSAMELTPDQLKLDARGLGLNTEQFNQCLDSGRFQAAVEKDLEEGRKIGVNSTPTLVVNGKLVTGGPSVDFYKKLIDGELEKAKEKQK